MACVAFAWAAWINLIVPFFSLACARKQTKAPGYEADGKPLTKNGKMQIDCVLNHWTPFCFCRISPAILFLTWQIKFFSLAISEIWPAFGH
jgi:hypothetical protein